MSSARQVGDELAEHLRGGGVDVGDRLRRDDDTADLAGAGVDPLLEVVGEVPGIGEEQRRVEPVQQQAGNRVTLRMASTVVVALQPVHPDEFCRVGLPFQADEVEDRQRDRDRGAGDGSEHGHRDRRGDGEDELAAPHPEEADHGRNVDERDRRRAHDRGQRGFGHVAERRGHRHGHEDHRHRSDDPGELGACPGGLRHRRTGTARADREAVEEPGGDVAETERDEFPAVVDRLAPPDRHRSRQHTGVGEGNERDAQGRTGEGADLRPAQVRPRGRGDATREVADDFQAVPLEVEHEHCDDAHDDRDERGRDARVDRLQHEDQREAQPTDGERPAVEVAGAQPAVHVANLSCERLARHGESAQLGELPDDDRDRDAVQVAVAHGRREQLGEEAEARQPGKDAHDAGDDRQHRRRGEALRGGQRHRREHGGRDQWGERRVRTDHHDARRPEQGVHEERDDRGVEAVHGGQPTGDGIRHACRGEETGEYQPGQEILRQPRALVSAEVWNRRKPPVDP